MDLGAFAEKRGAEPGISAEFAAAGIGSWELDLASGRLHCSPLFDRLFGYPHPDSHRRSAQDHQAVESAANAPWDLPKLYAHIASEDRENFAAQLASARTSGTLHTECRIRRADGSRCWLALSAGIRSDGEQRFLTGTVLDISERKRRERDSFPPQAPIDVADLALFADMGHEIRTPLNAMLGLNFLLQKTRLTPMQYDYAIKTEAAAQALVGALDDIVDFVRIERGQLRLDHVDFRLDQLLHNIHGVLGAALEEKGIDFVLSLAPEVPLALNGDPQRLQQILIALCANAIRTSDRGQIIVSVLLLDGDAEQARLYFSVRDSGIGLSASQLDGLFEIAQPAATGRARAGGLGLALSKRLLGMMGGAIEVRSAPGVGSDFNFSVRLQLAAPAAGTAALPPRAQRLERKRVLLVDDDALNRQVGSAILHHIGVAVETAVDGREAVALIERQGAGHFQLVLMDLQMPVLDGYEAARQIRLLRSAEELPIIAMTANVLENSGGCFAAGMNDYLTKPVNIPQLSSLLARWLRDVDTSARG